MRKSISCSSLFMENLDKSSSLTFANHIMCRVKPSSRHALPCRACSDRAEKY
ncbi:hypothetical protein PRIPAC_97153 [Pristionchus pacificus]|nr:hypothetical protein PRIPAC_97153 [Pristionchus pacificus]